MIRRILSKIDWFSFDVVGLVLLVVGTILMGSMSSEAQNDNIKVGLFVFSWIFIITVAFISIGLIRGRRCEKENAQAK